MSSLTSSQRRFSAAARVATLRDCRGRSAPRCLRSIICAHPLARWATISTFRCSPAITSPTTPAPASSTPRRATAARTSNCGWRAGRLLAERGIDTRIPYTVDENGAFTGRGARLHRQARAHRQGRARRRQQGGHQRAGRRRRADRARQAQASVPAFVAVEEADHLPQHAAMVHRHGQADRRPRREPARDGAEGDRRDALGARRPARTASAAWCRPSPTG